MVFRSKKRHKWPTGVMAALDGAAAGQPKTFRLARATRATLVAGFGTWRRSPGWCGDYASSGSRTRWLITVETPSPRIDTP
jgi:hypothetical protein